MLESTRAVVSEMQAQLDQIRREDAEDDQRLAAHDAIFDSYVYPDCYLCGASRLARVAASASSFSCARVGAFSQPCSCASPSAIRAPQR